MSPVSFKNDLTYDIIVYDSIIPDNPTDSETNYIGRLTQLAQVGAQSAMDVTPLHPGSAFVIESASAYKPIKRCTLPPLAQTTLFTIGQDDEDAMTETLQFLDFILHNKEDALTKDFYGVLQQNSKASLPAVNAFFQQHADSYKRCTYQTYMMGAVYVAQHPESIAKPPTEAKYSLSRLVECMGATWPEGLPDVTLSDLACSMQNGTLDMRATIDISELTFETDLIKGHVKSLLVDTTVKAELMFDLSISPGIFGTRLVLLFENFSIPAGSDKINVNQPTITVDINPLFKFAVLTVRGTVPFTITDRNLDANLSLTVDNVEAAINVDVVGDHSSLPDFPMLKGVHFDEFGMNMGLIFEPPAFAFGLQGKFHIGDSSGNVVALDDDTFALVMTVNEGCPTPLYVAFYVPRMDIHKVLEIFTNQSLNLSLPIEFSDLSFKWATNPMEPVVLPDGSLSEMAYGFRGTVNIGSFGFYGAVGIDMSNGLTADVEVSPLNWHDFFKLSGDGKGVTIKVDQNGNPIRNNEIRDKKVLQDALTTATDKQIVSPGGPVLNINTLQLPILHLNAKVSLFELTNYSINADVDQQGIRFLLDYGSVLMEKMSCTLSDFHNLAASFKFYLDRSITLPSLGDVHFGWFSMAASVETHVSINTSTSDIVFKVGGSFDFEGLTRTFGDFTADVSITNITDLLDAIGNYMEQEAKQIFGDFMNDAQKWTEKAKSWFISTETPVVTVLKDGFNKSVTEAASIMKNVGYTADEVAAGIKDAWNCGINDVTYVLNMTSYTAEEIGSSLKNTFNADAGQVLSALIYVGGYPSDKAASAIKTVFNLESNEVASVMKNGACAAEEVSDAFKNLFNISLNDTTTVLRNVGYAANSAAAGIKYAWSCGVNEGSSAMRTAGYAAQEVASALKDTFNAGLDETVGALKYAGYAANEVAGGVKNVWNCGINDVSGAMKAADYTAQEVASTLKDTFNAGVNDTTGALRYAGYPADEVASTVKNTFNISVDAVADAMKSVGYAANQVKDAFEQLGGDFANFVSVVWDKINPSNW